MIVKKQAHMEPIEALRIVFDPAQGNALDLEEAESGGAEMIEEYQRQQDALDEIWRTLEKGYPP